MQAGKLIHRVTIQSPTFTTNAHGEVEVSGHTDALAGVPCRVMEEGSTEVYRARQVQVDASHVVSMRWNRTVAHASRLKWTHGTTTRYLNVVGLANPDGKRIEMVVTCKESR